MKKCFLMILALLLCVCAVAEGADLILVTTYRQFGWGDRLEVGAVDADGGLWKLNAEEGALACPSKEAEAAEYLRGLGVLEFDGQLDQEELERLNGLIACVNPWDGKAIPVADDAGIQISWAMRNGEAVILGTSGVDLLENTDPNAQELYRVLRILFPNVTDFDGDEHLSPHGFQPVSLADFCGIAVEEGSTLYVKAYENDCETGAVAVETDVTAESLLSKRVVGKENALCVTGGTVTYVLTDAEGNCVGNCEFCGDLLVADDGMYRVE